MISTGERVATASWGNTSKVVDFKTDKILYIGTTTDKVN